MKLQFRWHSDKYIPVITAISLYSLNRCTMCFYGNLCYCKCVNQIEKGYRGIQMYFMESRWNDFNICPRCCNLWVMLLNQAKVGADSSKQSAYGSKSSITKHNQIDCLCFCIDPLTCPECIIFRAEFAIFHVSSFVGSTHICCVSEGGKSGICHQKQMKSAANTKTESCRIIMIEQVVSVSILYRSRCF